MTDLGAVLPQLKKERDKLESSDRSAEWGCRGTW